MGGFIKNLIYIFQDVKDDIHGAQGCGMLGILVQTGKLNSY